MQDYSWRHEVFLLDTTCPFFIRIECTKKSEKFSLDVLGI